MMKILMLTTEMSLGGAEWFLMRQAAYLKAHQHDVIIYNARPDISDRNLINLFPGLVIHQANTGFIKISVFLDRIWQKLFKKEIWVDLYNRFFLMKIIQSFNPDIIHSHLVTADYLAYSANKHTAKKHITTNHGDYIEYSVRNQEQKLLQMKLITNAIDKMIIISEQQKAHIDQFNNNIRHKIVKIYNGYPAVPKKHQRQRNQPFVFGMIARGIEKKGYR